MWPFMTGFFHLHDDVHKILPCISTPFLFIQLYGSTTSSGHSNCFQFGAAVLLGVFVCWVLCVFILLGYTSWGGILANTHRLMF